MNQTNRVGQQVDMRFTVHVRFPLGVKLTDPQIKSAVIQELQDSLVRESFTNTLPAGESRMIEVMAWGQDELPEEA